MSIVDSIKHTVTSIPGRVKNAAENGVDLLKATPGAAVEVAKDTYKAGKYLAENPPNPGQIVRTLKAVGHAAVSGDRTLIHGNLKDYATLSPEAKAAAAQRAKGQRIAQPFIAGDAKGTNLNEPVNLVVKGSKDDLVKALESQGWMKAPSRDAKNFVHMGLKVLFGTERDTNGPVSAAYLNGHSETMAFNKNDDYNAGRDHIRVYNAGKDPQTGEDVWQIAGTRDVAAAITIPHPTFKGIIPHFEAPHFGHEIDDHIDRERDQVMHDLLASKQVAGWQAVEGQRSGVQETRRKDGSYQVGDYLTDGRVDVVDLGSQVLQA